MDRGAQQATVHGFTRVGHDLAIKPHCCCCSVTKSCQTLCSPIHCSTPAFLSFTISGSLLKFMSVESVMPSNHLFPLCLRLLDTQMFPLDIYPGLPLAFREFLYHDPYFILKSKKYIMLYSDAKSLQSCPTLCDPIDGNPPGSPVPGILQVRTLEWVAISFSNA